MNTDRTKPPNFRFIQIAIQCETCDHSQHAPMVGSWCEKYNRQLVSDRYVCDDWEKIKTTKKKYVATMGYETLEMLDNMKKKT
jgi:hypothetical protein